MKIKKIIKSMKMYEPFVITWLGLSLTIYGITTFYLAFHNMDLAQNIEEINVRTNNLLLEAGLGDKQVFSETTSSGEVITDFNKLYAEAVINLFISLNIVIIGVFMVVVGIMSYEYLIGNFKKYYKR